MSKPIDVVTISRSKRGVTIKATGPAAQALFDKLAKEVDQVDHRAAPAGAAPAPTAPATTDAGTGHARRG